MISSFVLIDLIEMIITTIMFCFAEGLGINFLRIQLKKVVRWTGYGPLVVVPVLLIDPATGLFLFDHSD